MKSTDSTSDDTPPAATSEEVRELVALVVYSIVIDVVDNLATMDVVHYLDFGFMGGSVVTIPWGRLSGHLPCGFDVGKFLLWLVIPLALTWKTLDRGWFDPRRMTRRDGAFLGGLLLLGIGAMFLIPHFPELRETYPSLAGLDAARRLQFFGMFLLWTLSWLVGWEFLYRYVLLTRIARLWPGRAWVLIPVLEFVAHLQKPMLEAAGMFAFSMVLTPWVLRRRCVVPAFLAHLQVELALVVFMISI